MLPLLKPGEKDLCSEMEVAEKTMSQTPNRMEQNTMIEVNESESGLDAEIERLGSLVFRKNHPKI